MSELTAYEAAKKPGVSESHICRLIKQGKIKARKLGYMWLVDEGQLEYRRKRNPEGRVRHAKS